jgi:hypothetical protein
MVSVEVAVSGVSVKYIGVLNIGRIGVATNAYVFTPVTYVTVIVIFEFVPVILVMYIDARGEGGGFCEVGTTTLDGSEGSLLLLFFVAITVKV